MLLNQTILSYFPPRFLLHRHPQKRRERGRISVKGVRLVEPALLHGEGGDAAAPDVSSQAAGHCTPPAHINLFTIVVSFFVPTIQGYPFQVGYCESDGIYPGTTLPQYTLYLVADSEKERTEWISSIRKGRKGRGASLSSGVMLRFHVMFFLPSSKQSAKSIVRNRSATIWAFGWAGSGPAAEV